MDLPPINSSDFEPLLLRDGLLATTGSNAIDKTIKPASDTTMKRPPQRVDLSKGDLIRLLSYLEGELQARDVAIATLKTEKAKQLLYQAKYGRLGLNDPLAALQRDSEEVTGSKDDFDEAAIGRMYESQLAQLEKLIAVQRRAHHRAKQVLSSAERRHAKTVRELEHEKQRSVADAAQGDDVCMMLEKEREKLKQEIEYNKEKYEKLEKELEKAEKNLTDEKCRHKTIVLYLVNERRQLLVKMQDDKQKMTQLLKQRKQDHDQHGDSSRYKDQIQQLHIQLDQVVKEKEEMSKSLETERQESASLREIVRTQEEDLNLIRQNILAKTRQISQQQKNSTVPTSPTKLPSATIKSARPPPSYSAHQRQGSIPSQRYNSQQHIPSSDQQFPRMTVTPRSATVINPESSNQYTPVAEVIPINVESRGRQSLPHQYASTGSMHSAPQGRVPSGQIVGPRGRPSTFNQELRHQPMAPPPPPYDSPTGYPPVPVESSQSPSQSVQYQSGLTRQGSGRPVPAAAGPSVDPKKSPSAQSLKRNNSKSDDDRRPRQASDDSNIYANPYASDIPEIDQLEAVIDSLTAASRDSQSLPPSQTIPNGNGPPKTSKKANGPLSLVKHRSASLPRNSTNIGVQPNGSVPPHKVIISQKRMPGYRIPPPHGLPFPQSGVRPPTPVVGKRGLLQAFTSGVPRIEKKATQV